MNEIQVSDDFFTSEEQTIILNYCSECDYYYGERDNNSNPPTGMVHNIPEKEKVYHIIRNKIENSIPLIKQMEFDRMYVNCFAPSENPYFHIDGKDVITFLYYPEKEWSLNDGGETQFYVDDNLYGIIPKPNRMVMFDGSIIHRATSFRDRHRFTVAIKYVENK
jgi:hypothetical protein